jgi:hypothetical protein
VLAPLNRPTAVLTDKGQAVRAAYRLAHALAGLDRDTRADVMALLFRQVADDVAATA